MNNNKERRKKWIGYLLKNNAYIIEVKTKGPQEKGGRDET